MKNQLIALLVIFLGVIFQGNAQNYSMSNGTIATCSGTFLDNGGLGLYGNNQNITQTFSPSTPGRVIQIAFIPKSERGYSGTSNSRIRQIFGSRVSGLTDEQITALKNNPELSD